MMSDTLPFTEQDSQDLNQGGPVPAYAMRAAVPQVSSRNDPNTARQNGKREQGTPIEKVVGKDAPVGGDMESRKDISDYLNVKDLIQILVAIIFIDVVVLFITRLSPDLFGRNVNRWQDLFGLNAVICDVAIVFLGFIIARQLYTNFIGPKFFDGEFSSLGFTATTVGVQVIHDLLFQIGVIVPIPRGHNLMIDIFKDQAASGGFKIIGGDALMMVGSSAIAMILKQQPGHVVATFAALVSYCIPYILQTRNKYSVLR